MYENYGHIEDPPLRYRRRRYSDGAKVVLFFIFLGLVSAPVLMYVLVNDIELPKFEKSEPKKQQSKAKRRR